MAGSVKVKDFSIDKLKMHLESDKATVIGILPDSVVTKKKVIKINRGEDGDFKFDKNIDVAKVAVVERHQMTGNNGNGTYRRLRNKDRSHCSNSGT